VIVYEANELPIGPPRIDRVELGELPAVALTVRSTLFVPPISIRPRDETLVARLEALLGTG
jgi:hypothetical protein